MCKRVLFLLIMVCSTNLSWAFPILGGDITWVCSGNGYVFSLHIYRDCKDADLPATQVLRVWNHPTVKTISLNLVSRKDISPTCTQVTGGGSPITCGTGAGGGNQLGAVEELVYSSTSIILSGKPGPGNEWSFTFGHPQRSQLITNIASPSSDGMTISARMFATPGAQDDICADNSPHFVNLPYIISCSREAFQYNLHPTDVELDSLSTQFSAPLNDFLLGSYDPPFTPAAATYANGFSKNSPTPSPAMNPGNIASKIDQQSGQISFLSQTPGGYLVKLLTKSYRNNRLIAEVEREVLFLVVDCNNTNTAPIIQKPFASGFETTINAGTAIAFNINVNDNDLLANGAAQSIEVEVQGELFGPTQNNPTGCQIAPCPTVNTVTPITFSKSGSLQFNWQTSCDHLFNNGNNSKEYATYRFVVTAKDNNCPVPKLRHETITIHVKNPGILAPTKINCVTTLPNGTIQVSWDPVVDTLNTFTSYQLYSVEEGLLGTFPKATTSITIPATTGFQSLYIRVNSGCNGGSFTDSPIVKNAFIEIENKGTGNADLIWNHPFFPMPDSSNVVVYREYPTGVWTAIDTLDENRTSYSDEIDICSAFLNYRIDYINTNCNFASNIVGGNFKDLTNPKIPSIQSVSIDSTTGFPILKWNVNAAEDLFGYVIYTNDEFGFLKEIDTVYGRFNTTYIHSIIADTSLTYSVAAFDSCLTNAVPPTYQTSAKASLHSSIFLTTTNEKCTDVIDLKWTPYKGWEDNLKNYQLVAKIDGADWKVIDSTEGVTLSHTIIPNKTYVYAIRAVRSDGRFAYSNLDTIRLTGPKAPFINYFHLASVTGTSIELKYRLSREVPEMSYIRFERYNERLKRYEKIAQVPITGDEIVTVDTDVEVQNKSYRYRGIIVDSCERDGPTSNEVKTILLKVSTDQTRHINYLNWSHYSGFMNGVLQYDIYRSINGIMDPTPIGSVTSHDLSFSDDVSSYSSSDGQFCYYISALEGSNPYNLRFASNSNVACVAITPLVYIPTAFTPGGFNPIFKPVVSFTDIKDYRFSIVDRTGRVVYFTNDSEAGWNGDHSNGEQAATGVFVYVLEIKDGNDQELVFRGNLTLLR